MLGIKIGQKGCVSEGIFGFSIFEKSSYGPKIKGGGGFFSFGHYTVILV